MFKIKENLEKNKDYKVLNEHLYMMLHTLYGGGPLLRCSQADIYSIENGNEEESILDQVIMREDLEARVASPPRVKK